MKEPLTEELLDELLSSPDPGCVPFEGEAIEAVFVGIPAATAG